MSIRRQYLLGKYILDFYIPGLWINIEVDGGSHEGRIEYDRLRDQELRLCGVRVVRLAAELVETDLPAALGLIIVEIARAVRLRGTFAGRE
jgi:very-short-patch-repair endonuclease